MRRPRAVWRARCTRFRQRLRSDSLSLECFHFRFVRRTRFLRFFFGAIFGDFQRFSVNPADFDDSGDDFSMGFCAPLFCVAISSLICATFKFLHLARDFSKGKLAFSIGIVLGINVCGCV